MFYVKNPNAQTPIPSQTQNLKS